MGLFLSLSKGDEIEKAFPGTIQPHQSYKDQNIGKTFAQKARENRPENRGPSPIMRVWNSLKGFAKKTFESESAKQIEIARKEESKGHIEEAVLAYTKALERGLSSEKKFEVLWSRAQLYEKKKEKKLAAADCKCILEISSLGEFDKSMVKDKLTRLEESQN